MRALIRRGSGINQGTDQPDLSKDAGFEGGAGGSGSPGLSRGGPGISGGCRGVGFGVPKIHEKTRMRRVQNSRGLQGVPGRSRAGSSGGSS